MSKIKRVKEEALATINAALTIINNFPELEDANTELSFNTSANPFSFLIDLFKSTTGYNILIEILARFISYELPAIEAAVKAMLLSQLKDILSCSVNPFLTEEILRDGIVFNIAEIDIADVLKYSPLDRKVGMNFYFGTDGVRMVDDLKYCRDMDAFIWFIINKSNRRYAWKPETEENGSDNGRRSNNGTERDKKTDGIITLEYYENAQNLRDAYGNNYDRQTPYNNCLHVFIGNAEEDPGKINELIEAENNLRDVDEKIDDINNDIELQQYKRDTVEQEKSNLREKYTNQEIDEETYKTTLRNYKDKLNQINNKLNAKKDELSDKLKDKKGLQYTIGNFDLRAMGESIFSPFFGTDNKPRNYYYGHTLIEFNIDYIMSVKLFDEKVLAARLIDSLTGVLTINLGLTYKQQLIKNEVKKMVDMIVESDDLVVSDCFFTFSNDDYDALSRQAELRKAGLLSMNGDEMSAVKINAEDVLSGLNSLNEGATQETIQTVIEGTLTELSKELSSVSYEEKESINFGVQINFIENIMSHLAYVLVSAVLSPKVYLLLLINLKIMGQETNFNLEQFLGSYKQMLASIIRAIRDMLIEYLVRELMKIVGELVNEVAAKINIEQAQYYARLIKKLIECFRNRGNTYDWQMDNVDYADIYEEESEPTNSEC